MTWVYGFAHRHSRAPRDLKALLGGKGANLAEMTSVLALPVPPGFTITTEACRAYMATGWPGGLDDEIEGHVRSLERFMGRHLGDPDDPLLVSVRSGAAFSMPGMMDTILDLGLNDDSVEGLAARTDERFALDSYRRLLAMYGRIVLEIPARALRRSAGGGQGGRRGAHGRRGVGRSPHGVGRRLPTGHRRRHRIAVPPGPAATAAGSRRGGVPVVGVAAGPGLSAPRAHRRRSRDGGQHPVDGLRQPRRSVGHRRRVHPGSVHRHRWGLRRLPGQRAGRGRGGGHPHHAPARLDGGDLPGRPHRADVHPRTVGAPLPRHARLRVHRRERPALDAADPGGQAHRCGRAANRRGPHRGSQHPHLAGRGRAARSTGAPRPGPASPARGRDGAAAHHRASRLTRRGRRPRLLRRRPGRGRRRSWRAGRPGASGDLARGRPRHRRRPGRAHLPRGSGQPCRRRRPRVGQARGGRRREPHDRAGLDDHLRRHRRARGRLDLPRRRPRHRVPRRAGPQGGQRPQRVRHRARVGRRDPRRPARGAGQRRHRTRRRPGP